MRVRRYHRDRNGEREAPVHRVRRPVRPLGRRARVPATVLYEVDATREDPMPTTSLTLLMNETMDGLGHLVAEHVRLSKLEVLGSLEVMVRQTARVLVV